MPSTSTEARNVLTGADGRLYLVTDAGAAGSPASNLFLAHVTRCRLVMHNTNLQWRPIGQDLIFNMKDARAYSIVLSETIVVDSDTPMLLPLVAAIQNNSPVFFNMVVSLFHPVTKALYESVALYNLIPDGDVDLAMIQSGATIQRDWTLLANTKPNFISAAQAGP